MKKSILISFPRLFVLLAFFLSVQCTPVPVKTLRTHIALIESKFVPDKRTGIFQSEIRKDRQAGIIITGETLYPEAVEEIKEMIKSKGWQITDSMMILPEPELEDKTWGLISVSVANIRSKPSHPAELVTQAVMGNPVRILKKKQGWFLVQTPDNYIGWTNTSSVQPMSFSGLEEWNGSERLMFNGLHGSIFSESTSGKIVSDLVAGTIIVRLSENESGFMVRLPDGRTGKVEKQGFLPFRQWAEQVKTTQESVISTALMFSGLPYLWGGTSSKALDCSGFTRTVYFLNGLILERDASQQIRHGLKVSPENKFMELEPGDLLFYGRKEPIRVVHVGIWLGKSEVIHASGLVKIESMVHGLDNFSDYLHDTFLGEVRRIIGNDDDQGIIEIRNHPWYF